MWIRTHTELEKPTLMKRIISKLPRLLAPLMSALLFAGIAHANGVLSIAQGNGTIKVYDLQDIDALPVTQIETLNDWVDEETRFSGPLLRDLLESVGADMPELVRFVAINDYSVEIPTTDFWEWDVILAVRMNGELLSPRDKGHYWVIYPVSSNPELKDPLYNARHIWQVVRMEID